MKPFSHRRTKRITTFVAFVVWAFALASGMANACLLEIPGQHAHGVALPHSSEVPHVHAVDEPISVGIAVDDHDDDRDVSKESCQSNCDDGASALVKARTGVDLVDPGLASLVMVEWTKVMSVVSVPSRFEILQVPIVGPPLRVRYSRLAL